MKLPPLIDFCATHAPKSRELGYIAHAEWLQKQRRAQRRCPTCQRWLFRSEYGHGWAKGEREPKVLKPADHGYLLDGDQR